jgi:hypothetical protein
VGGTNFQIVHYFDHVYLEGEQPMKTNIPHKLTTGKKKLPWVDDQLRLKLNKAKRLHRKRKNSEAQMKKYKHIKKTIQQDMRKAYWEFIETIFFNIPDQEPDECRKKQPKTSSATSRV